MKNLKVLALLVLTVAMLLTCFTSCDQLAEIPGIENILDLLPGADNHEHTFSEATCTTPATCECGETNGDALGHTFTEGKCECGETDPNYVPPHEHNFVDGKCECGETDPNYIPPHEHSFVDGKCECGETDPNYVAPHEHNFVDGKCECGETDPNYVAPHEHNFVDGKCECGETDPNYVPPHEHNFVDGVCECGEVDPEYVAPCEHNYEMIVGWHPLMVAADCVTPGVEVYECTLCFEIMTVDTEIDPNAHAFWGEEEIVSVADCTTKTNGLKKVHCANEGCNAVEEVEVYYSEVHNWDVQKEVNATCTTDGEYYAVCTLCGEIDAYDIPAGGHYNWFLTCGQTGECLECGEEFTKEHDTSWNPATCTEPAFCTNCWSNVGEALGHTFVDGVCVCGEEYVAPEANGDWALVTELKTGDLVLIGAPAYGKLLSMVKVSTYYNKGVDYSVSDFSNVTDDEIFVVTVNDDGTYTFVSLSGKLLAQEGTYASLNDAGTQKSWVLEPKDGADGIFYLKNTGTGKYLEWYASKDNWSTYAGTLSDLFELSFYAKSVSAEDHVHNYISEEHDATCTTGSYTSYTCSCGEGYTVEGDTAATGHSYEAVVTAPTCTEAGFTTYTCTCGDSYTADEVAALGHTFIEGKCECGETDASYVPPFGGGSADFGTIVLPSSKPTGDSSYTATYTTTNGWVTEYSAIQCGGTTDMNPQYTVIGPDNTYKAVCLNGKTSAPGRITSPVLVDGLSKLTVKFTKIFTDTELSVTVTVTELSTGNVYTYVIARSLDKNEKYQVYTEVWTLDVPVIGDFTIEIVNNCPTNQNSNKDRFTILSIVWEGAAPAHEHEYTMTTTATCTAAGVSTYTCACGDTYTEECDVLDHVDANLDITCDFDGCTKRILPEGDTKISLFTANHMVIISLSSNYYVEGTVTSVEDARNGKFVITDEAGDTILIYLPVDENGITHANWVSKILVGDVVRVYGKPVGTAGLNTDQTAAVKSGVLTFITKHPHVFGEPTCLLPGYCACGQDGPVALGHIDETGDDLCDRCEFNLKLDIETISTKYNDVKGTDKADTTNGVVTFDGVNFTATFAKDTATLNTNGTDHMRLNKGNKLTVTSNNGKNIVGITLVAVSSSYVDELELYCQALGYEYTVDGNEVTFYVDTCTSLELANTSTKAQRIAAVKVIYEK